jgi:glycosyltransferase involved in cell wall biosynthesis
MGGFWPGHEATGPNQSLRHLCMALQGDCSFSIVARDRPVGSSIPTADSSRWHETDIGQLHYVTAGFAGVLNLRNALRTPHDLLWLNGFHDREFTLPALVLRRLRLIPQRPTVLSVRGEMSSGALGLKPTRKEVYRTFAHRARLLSDVFIHATSPLEAADIERWFPWSKGVLTAPNIRSLVDVDNALLARHSRPQGSYLRVVLVGRITRVKNILFAIETMSRVTVPASLKIVGPIEDADYWLECERAIVRLPSHVTVKAVGTVPSSAIPNLIATADLFFSPTLGENFGHAIFEALACGVPVLISDRTPWTRLSDQNAGWELPLNSSAPFAARIDDFFGMSQVERSKLRVGARALAERFVADSDAISATRRLIAVTMNEAEVKGSRVTA